MFAPSEAFRHLTQALELWSRVPDAAAVAGVDRVEVLVQAAEAASHSGEFRQAVGLAEEAVEAVDEDAEPLRAATAYERLSSYLLDAELELARIMEPMLAASRRAVELVPEQPPTPLRARVAAGLARSLMVARDYEGARRWGEEALEVARPPAASATRPGRWSSSPPGAALRRRGHGPPDAARRRPGGRRRRQPPLELQARHALGLFELDLGNLAAACTALDQATELAERSGLAWSGYGIDSRVLRCICPLLGRELGRGRARGQVGVDERRPAVSAAALYVEIGRAAPPPASGWPASSPTGRPTRTSPTWPAAARPTWSAGRATRNAPASWPARPSDPGGGGRAPGC